VRREDFSGARTALSACSCRIGAFARTKLSALLWLRLGVALKIGWHFFLAAAIDGWMHDAITAVGVPMEPGKWKVCVDFSPDGTTNIWDGLTNVFTAKSPWLSGVR
jgi:hypothetical protein